MISMSHLIKIAAVVSTSKDIFSIGTGIGIGIEVKKIMTRVWKGKNMICLKKSNQLLFHVLILYH